MKQYIDKEVIVAEIKSLKRTTFSNFDEGVNAAAQILLDFLDNMEVKEVDLNDEIDKWICDAAITHEDCDVTDVISTAKHFFEVGLLYKGE